MVSISRVEFIIECLEVSTLLDFIIVRVLYDLSREFVISPLVVTIPQYGKNVFVRAYEYFMRLKELFNIRGVDCRRVSVRRAHSQVCRWEFIQVCNSRSDSLELISPRSEHVSITLPVDGSLPY